MVRNVEGLEPLALVAALIECENQCDKETAAKILAPDFAGITRMTGVEQNRDDLLAAIAKPAKLSVHRDLDKDPANPPWIKGDAGFAVTRTIVLTHDTATPEEPHKRFRNMHVFSRASGRWQCLAWQVTQLS